MCIRTLIILQTHTIIRRFSARQSLPLSRYLFVDVQAADVNGSGDRICSLTTSGGFVLRVPSTRCLRRRRQLRLRRWRERERAGLDVVSVRRRTIRHHALTVIHPDA